MVLKSQVNPNSQEFKENYNHNKAIVKSIREFLKKLGIKEMKRQ
jgi:hypothetical protein